MVVIGGNETVSEKRRELLKRAAAFQSIHGPKYKNMSDEQLEHFITSLERAFKESFEEEDDESNI